MKRTFLSAILLVLMVCPMLFAQQGDAIEEPVNPETTVFYFGQNIESDILMIESVARFDSRAPLGTVVGMVQGLTGEATIWLDSIMLEQVDAVEPAAIYDVTEAEGDMVEDTAGVIGGDVAAAIDSTPATEHVPAIEPPTGYQKPLASFEIPISTFSTGNAARDEMFKSEEYLDVANYPIVNFELTGIQDPSSFQLKDGEEVSLTASGELTLHGISKRYSNIKVYMTYIEEKPITKQNTGITGNLLHFTVEMTINLSDFAISIQPENLLTIDNKVKIMMDAFGSTKSNTSASE
jgi:YceI-like domain